MVAWGYAAIGAGLLLAGGYLYKKYGPLTLDWNLPADMRARVLDALKNETDPTKLEALANTLIAYPKAKAALLEKAAKLRTAMQKPAPSGGSSFVPQPSGDTHQDNNTASPGDTVVPAGSGTQAPPTPTQVAEPIVPVTPTVQNPWGSPQGTDPNSHPTTASESGGTSENVRD